MIQFLAALLCLPLFALFLIAHSIGGFLILIGVLPKAKEVEFFGPPAPTIQEQIDHLRQKWSNMSQEEANELADGFTERLKVLCDEMQASVQDK